MSGEGAQETHTRLRAASLHEPQHRWQRRHKLRRRIKQNGGAPAACVNARLLKLGRLSVAEVLISGAIIPRFANLSRVSHSN